MEWEISSNAQGLSSNFYDFPKEKNLVYPVNFIVGHASEIIDDEPEARARRFSVINQLVDYIIGCTDNVVYNNPESHG